MKKVCEPYPNVKLKVGHSRNYPLDAPLYLDTKFFAINFTVPLSNGWVFISYKNTGSYLLKNFITKETKRVDNKNPFRLYLLSWPFFYTLHNRNSGGWIIQQCNIETGQISFAEPLLHYDIEEGVQAILSHASGIILVTTSTAYLLTDFKECDLEVLDLATKPTLIKNINSTHSKVNGNLLLLASLREFQLWDIVKGGCYLADTLRENETTYLSILFEGLTIVVNVPSNLYIWRLGKVIDFVEFPQEVPISALQLKDRYLIAANIHGVMTLYDIQLRQMLYKLNVPHTDVTQLSLISQLKQRINSVVIWDSLVIAAAEQGCGIWSIHLSDSTSPLKRIDTGGPCKYIQTITNNTALITVQKLDSPASCIDIVLWAPNRKKLAAFPNLPNSDNIRECKAGYLVLLGVGKKFWLRLADDTLHLYKSHKEQHLNAEHALTPMSICRVHNKSVVLDIKSNGVMERMVFAAPIAELLVWHDIISACIKTLHERDGWRSSLPICFLDKVPKLVCFDDAKNFGVICKKWRASFVKIVKVLTVKAPETDNEKLRGLDKRFPNLRQLELCNCYRVSDNGLLHIGMMTKLTSINLQSCGVSPDGLRHLSNLSKLKVMSLQRCSYINDNACHRIAFLFPSLRKLDVGGCARITDEGVKSLAKLKSLRVLNLWYCRSLTDTTLDHIAMGLKKLHTLIVTGCTLLTDYKLHVLNKIPRLNIEGIEGLIKKNGDRRNKTTVYVAMPEDSEMNLTLSAGSLSSVESAEEAPTASNIRVLRTSNSSPRLRSPQAKLNQLKSMTAGGSEPNFNAKNKLRKFKSMSSTSKLGQLSSKRRNGTGRSIRKKSSISGAMTSSKHRDNDRKVRKKRSMSALYNKHHVTRKTSRSTSTKLRKSTPQSKKKPRRKSHTGYKTSIPPLGGLDALDEGPEGL